MRVSLNTIKKFTEVTLPVYELVDKINAQLGGVEEVVEMADRYKDVRVARIISCTKHPNADKLSVCLIDTGKGEQVQVVCGAPNVKEGLLVAWLPPGSSVPSSYSDPEPFVLGARELRGVMSHGMLASPKELGLGESHEGILEIDEDLKPGSSFATAFGLDDVLIDIENKMFTHRPDCFGQLGVAREISGILHQPFHSPVWYTDLPSYHSGEGLDLKVKNEAGSVVPRFVAAAVKNVKIKQSPVWLQAELIRLGSKPINNIVDITNYVMLLTGQPLHAYDYDRLSQGQIGARLARSGDKVKLLNGKTYELHETDIVIVDGKNIVGLGGVMGGGNSEVNENTSSIVVECATFDMYAVRKTSMRHGLFTDAVTRFNKGQSPLQNEYILSLALRYIDEIAGGELASQVFDAHGAKKLVSPAAVSVNASFINERLGLSLQSSEINRLLSNVEFSVTETHKGKQHTLLISPPYWRTDIEIPEDIVEEIGRLYGFDKLPKVLPKRTITPASQNPNIALKNQLRRSLSTAGANEVLTYSFVHENLLTNAGQNPKYAYKLSNALSPDLQYYRTSLMPSLLDKVHMNLRTGYDSFALFELGKVHFKGEMDADEPSVPNEDNHLALVIAHKKMDTQSGAIYYQARTYLHQILNINDFKLMPLKDFDTSTDVWGRELTAAYDPLRSAVIVKNWQIRGIIGEFKASVTRAFKLPEHTAGFEIHTELLKQKELTYAALSRFPSVWQDISLKVGEHVNYASVYDIIRKVTETSEWNIGVKPTSIYQSIEQAKYKTFTFRFTVSSSERTLTDKEVSGLLELVESALRDIGAIRI